MISGRPLDEANPILDTQLEIGKIRARIAIIQQPLSPDGLAYSIRRHRESPWTLPLFVRNKMINPLGAGLMSFLIDGARTLLIAGTRSSGKTSFLGSLMLEIIPKVRIIVIEDSLELPVESLRKLNYDILRMKVRSALLKTTTEVSADDGIRTSLRLGDSSLIVGEVRSEEAKALYEAMRVGALANVVAGTIHGASPYGVFDRVVNDLGVPTTSFKATDIIVVANPIKSPDGMHSKRRIVRISEIRKHWEKDPLAEKGFVDLMKYNVEKDELEPTDDLINGDSEILKEIASNVRGWAGNWDAVWDNIMLRAQMKEELVKIAEQTKKFEILEADFIQDSNSMFHEISDEVAEEHGIPLSEHVFPRWKKWLEKEVRKKF
jgi:type IV secretory pathway ATPase VirB11/archaellum biosynthesis ATPase